MSNIDSVRDNLNSDIEQKVMEFLAEKQGWSELEVERHSNEDFDFKVSGRMKYGPRDEDTVRFQASPKLALIREASWPSYAGMSDYPDMVEGGDWSGVRDSCQEAKDAMFLAALDDLGFSQTPAPGCK